MDKTQLLLKKYLNDKQKLNETKDVLFVTSFIDCPLYRGFFNLKEMSYIKK